MIKRPPKYTRTDQLFPYTTRFRSSITPTEAPFDWGLSTKKTPGRPRVSPNQDSHPPGLNFPALLQKRRGTQNHGNAVRYPYVNAGQAMRPVRLASSQFYFDVHDGRKIPLHQPVDRLRPRQHNANHSTGNTTGRE